MGESDTKIYAKVFALRLAKTLPSVINSNQTAYVNGRFIGEGLKTIEGIIEYVKQRNIEGYLLSIDFEKAFDSIDFEFLWATLKAFGYPDEFIQKIRIFYQDIQTKVINGGTTTDFFTMCRGVMQGFPPAGFLFVLAIEMLLIRIRADKNIRGITINNSEIKLNAFADDITNFLADLPSAEVLLSELEKFGRVSGLNCNVGKCKIMAISAQPQQVFSFNSEIIEWVKEMLITGINFTLNPDTYLETNYKEVVEKLRTKLQIWQSRDLSLLGKIQVLKSVGISQLQLVMNMVEPSAKIFMEISSIFRKFLWGNDNSKVKINTIIAKYEDGGLKMPDIFTIHQTQRIKWVQRFLTASDHSWKHICNWQLQDIGGSKIFQNTAINTESIDQMNMLVFFIKV